jgi:Uma2 family endonuclease
MQDYRYQGSESAARGIAGYWIVDPILQKVTVYFIQDLRTITSFFES